MDPADTRAQRDLISFKASAPGSLGGGEGQTLEQIRALSAVNPVEWTLALADFYAGRKKFDQADEEYQKVLKSPTAKINAYNITLDQTLADIESADHANMNTLAALRPGLAAERRAGTKKYS